MRKTFKRVLGTILLVSMMFSVLILPAKNTKAFADYVKGYWNFKNGTAYDDSWCGNNGTVVGSPSKSRGIYDDCLTFNGSNYVQISNSSSINFGTGDFSIDFWFKTSSQKINNTIIDKRDSTGKGYCVTIYDGHPLIQIADSTGFYNYWGGYNSQKFNEGKWHHATFTVDRDNPEGLKIYIDGQVVHTFNPTAKAGDITNSAYLYIAKHKDGTSNNFEGCLDGVGLYNKVLSYDEVTDFYCQGISSLYPASSGDYRYKVLSTTVTEYNCGPLQANECIVSLAPGSSRTVSQTYSKKTTTTLNYNLEAVAKLLKIIELTNKLGITYSREITVSKTISDTFTFPISQGYNSYDIYAALDYDKAKISVEIQKKKEKKFLGIVIDTDWNTVDTAVLHVKKPKVVHFGYPRNTLDNGRSALLPASMDRIPDGAVIYP